MLTRRAALVSAAGIAFLPRRSVARFLHDGGAVGSAPAGNLTAEITFPGGSPVAGTLVFDQSAGTDLGNYVAPTAGFTQKCIRATNGSLANFMVDFRPDVSGGRVEVVFWNGQMDPVGLTVASGFTRDLPPYTVTIKQGGVSIYTASIPYHTWGCRWRYQSAVRPEIRSAAQVFSDGFLPHMSQAAARISGTNLSTGKPWSGLPYTDPSGNIIVPPVPPAVGTYSPFMPPDVGNASFTTTTAAPAALGATSVSLTSAAGIAHALSLTLTLTDGSKFTAVVTSADATNPVTIYPALPLGVNSGAAAYVSSYKLGIQTPTDGGGERPEIGLVTEWQADYLLRGTASSKNAIYQQAEMAAGDWHWFLPDKSTNCCLNQKSDSTHYKVSMFYNQVYGSYYLAGVATGGFWNGWSSHEADSHLQSMFYVPYALTEDPYYVEAQQYIVNGMLAWNILGKESTIVGNLNTDPSGNSGVNGPFTVCSDTDEIRTLGWGIRNMACARKMSPTSPPSWLLPQSYYDAVSKDYTKVINLTYTTNNTFNVYKIFHQLSSDPFWQAFEQSYALMGMALADLVGCPAFGTDSWNAELAFYFGWFDAMFNGTSGWNRQTPQPHDIQSGNTGSTTCPNLDFQLFNDWTSLSNALSPCLKSGATFPNAASPGNQQGPSMGNTAQLFAATACAKSRGIAAATGGKTWLDTFVDYNYPNNADAAFGIAFFAKCGFDGT